jgi:hypothetical protein
VVGRCGISHANSGCQQYSECLFHLGVAPFDLDSKDSPMVAAFIFKNNR